MFNQKQLSLLFIASSFTAITADANETRKNLIKESLSSNLIVAQAQMTKELKDQTKDKKKNKKKKKKQKEEATEKQLKLKETDKITIKRAKWILKKKKLFTGTINDKADKSLEAALIKFQEKNQLEVNGKLNKETASLLIKEDEFNKSSL